MNPSTPDFLGSTRLSTVTPIALCHYLFFPGVHLYLGLKGLQLLSNPCHAAPDLRQQVFLLQHPDARFELGDSIERRLVHRSIPAITRFGFSSCQSYESAACFSWTKAGFVRISCSKRKYYLLMKKFQKMMSIASFDLGCLSSALSFIGRWTLSVERWTFASLSPPLSSDL